jgi:sodium-dependent phosphate transporter
MMWALNVGTLWLLWATYYGLNVSSTHSIVGAIMGFALSYSKDGVLWLVDPAPTDLVPIPKGIVPIVVAWFFAPVATGLASSVLFILIRTFVLRTANSYNKALYLLPCFVLFTGWINVYFVFTKGAKKTFTDNKASFCSAN